MIKRPLSPQFADLVTQGRKTTTIRRKAWPLGKTIMLYRWEGKAYRSKQVKVVHCQPIKITHRASGPMTFEPCRWFPLWQTEGFESPEALDAWFREKIAPGATVQMVLMDFVVVDVPAEISMAIECLAAQMDEVAVAMKYYGGFSAEMIQRARELRRGAKRMRAWVKRNARRNFL